MSVLFEDTFLLMLGDCSLIWLSGKREMNNLIQGSTNTYTTKMSEKSTEVEFLKLWNMKVTIIGSIHKMQVQDSTNKPFSLSMLLLLNITTSYLLRHWPMKSEISIKYIN